MLSVGYGQQTIVFHFTLGVNCINILLEHFLDESALHSFSLVHFVFVNFWQKDIGEKKRM